ncbi:hypothetical protein EX30DRAFT_371539 [Ascodesmis nigricans]|uniref:RING-type E3 ubiquitin transferase n=1 Tax=Ascodesmis nigricans TaxID=341454 RepID=A0A4S2MWX2_9PEZI|nr:hypothetical protein EX30DRAFT_371539 [Ascodesmis nigricans]
MTPDSAASDTPNCTICLEPVSDDCLALPCKHHYDHICLLSWLQLRPECPLCKAQIRFIRVFNSSTGKAVLHRVEQPPRASNPENPIILHNRASFRRRRHRPLSSQPEHVSEDTSVLQRRHIYRTGMRALHVGSNRISRFRNFAPRMVRDDEELQSRAKMWIRRELRVFKWTNENSEFILEYILAILKTIDIRSSTGAAEDMLTEFLGRDNAKIFIHELHEFLRFLIS